MLTHARTVVPRPGLAEELVSFSAPGSVEANQYRMLRQAIERLHAESGFQVLATTSAGPGDGKTVTTLNLAGSLAQSVDARILLVDADLHRSSATRYLGLTSLRSPGLAEALADDRYGVADVTLHLESLNLSIVPAGATPSQPYELLASSRLAYLLAEARRLYDYILIDTPPVVPLADCRILGRCVDGFVMVVAANRTPRKLFVEALHLVDRAKVLGVVFNGDDRPLSSYYGYYGYGDYTRPDDSSSRANPWREQLVKLLRSR